MSRLLTWFAHRPVTTVALAAAYFAAVVLSHQAVQDLAYWLQRTFTREIWAPVVAVIAFAGAAWLAWRAWRAPRGAKPPRAVSVAWWGSLAGALVASLTLLATNMETIHFAQYALLALPVLALTGRFGATVLVVTVLGAFDELYQWTWLHPGWAVRFDANDVVLNALGAALACAGAAVFGGVRPAPAPTRRSLAATWAPVLAVALVLGGGGPVLAAEHRLAVHRGDWCPHTWVTLSRARRPDVRWKSPERARRHHILHPGAALAICLVLAAGFSALDDRWRIVVDPPAD
jgi:hypothetical protein